MIWTELRSRFSANRLMVICPAMLRDKWQSELEIRLVKKHTKARKLGSTYLLAKNYHRLAVAYGLSHTADDRKRVMRPRQMKDIVPHVSTKNYTNNYIGSEMM